MNIIGSRTTQTFFIVITSLALILITQTYEGWTSLYYTQNQTKTVSSTSRVHNNHNSSVVYLRQPPTGSDTVLFLHNNTVYEQQVQVLLQNTSNISAVDNDDDDDDVGKTGLSLSLDTDNIIYESKNSTIRSNNSTSSNDTNDRWYIEFQDFIHDQYKQFEQRYGGHSIAQHVINSSIENYQNNTYDSKNNNKDDTLNVLSEEYGISGSIAISVARLLRARESKEPFKVAFGGYSNLNARGNFFNESYSFVFERLMRKPLEMLDIGLKVTNGGIGGIGAFPYIWCADNFYGVDADVVTYDFGMNEDQVRNESAFFAVFLDSILESFTSSPLFIMYNVNGKEGANKERIYVTNNFQERTSTLREYIQKGLFYDALTISLTNETIAPVFGDKNTTSVSNIPGFSGWDQWGGVENLEEEDCFLKAFMGRTFWHIKKQEHNLFGWLTFYHFLSILKTAGDAIHKNDIGRFLSVLPPQLEEGRNYLRHCATEYKPYVNKIDLKSLVISDNLSEHEDIIHDRWEVPIDGDWVVDVHEGELRASEGHVGLCDFGYPDRKAMLVGTNSSGTLEFWIPFNRPAPKNNKSTSSSTIVATDYLNGPLILCERFCFKGCTKLNDDEKVHIEINGRRPKIIQKRPIAGQFAGYGENLCYDLYLDEDMDNLPTRKSSRKNGTISSSNELKHGISLNVTVKKNATDPCTISHIIWDEKKV